MALASDSFELEEVSDPGSPAADKARIYVQDEQGYSALRYREAAGDPFDIRRDRVIVVRNVSGSTIAKGRMVYISGQSGGVPTIDTADPGPYGMPVGNIAQAVTVEQIVNNAYGRVLSYGILGGLNTSSFTAGALLYLGTTGLFTATAISHPYIVQRVARVLTSHASTGTIFFDPQGGAGHPEGSANQYTRFGDPTTDPGTEGPTVLEMMNQNGILELRSLHTNNRTILFPDTTGTVALLADIPSPGGSNDQVQYKNGAAFAGAAQLTINAAGFPILGESTSAPTTPAAGNTVFSRYHGGRRQVAHVDPGGQVYLLQPSWGLHKIGVWTAQGNGTTVALVNFGNSTTGTATLRNVATTGLETSLRRLAFVSVATAGGSAGTRHNALQFYRGNAADRAGFYYCARFTIDTVQTDMRWFVGMYGASEVIGNVNPSTLTNIVGVGIDSGQTTVRFFNNDGSGTATATDLGANFPATTAGVVYALCIFCPPNGSTISYVLRRQDVTQSTEGSTSTDIPSSTTLLSPQIWINNGATAAAVTISVITQYTETYL